MFLKCNLYGSGHRPTLRYRGSILWKVVRVQPSIIFEICFVYAKKHIETEVCWNRLHFLINRWFRCFFLVNGTTLATLWECLNNRHSWYLYKLILSKEHLLYVLYILFCKRSAGFCLKWANLTFSGVRKRFS